MSMLSSRYASLGLRWKGLSCEAYCAVSHVPDRNFRYMALMFSASVSRWAVTCGCFGVS